MARRRRRGRRGGMKIPILSLAILGGQVASAHAGGGSIADKVARFTSYYTGFDFGSRVFDVNALIIGYAPWAALGIGKRLIFPLVGRPRLGKMLPVSLS